jgi:hypothetical protein
VRHPFIGEPHRMAKAILDRFHTFAFLFDDGEEVGAVGGEVHVLAVIEKFRLPRVMICDFLG